MSDLFGGDSPSPQPVQQQITSTELPSWAVGYGKDILAKGAALTDISQNPYQAYKGQRIADFSGLQKTAMANVASPEAWGKSVQGYMSPYMQNVVEQQQRNAREQAGAQAGALNARAAQMGAFGGSGVALQRAAQDRDLMKQLENIQATGLQTAFQQGTQQANTALGQQMQLGALQQAQQQRGYDVAYQDFLNQKNYPYQQLSFMSNLVRGTPMGMNTQSQVYQAPGNQLGQLAGLGMMGYGMSRMAEGGQVEGYADGGSIMDKFNDPGEMLVEMDKLTDTQLQAIIAAPSTRAEAMAAKEELAQRASDERGLSNAWEQVPYSNRENIVRAAGGGVLAFKDGGDKGEYVPTSSYWEQMGNVLGLIPEGIKSLVSAPGYGFSGTDKSGQALDKEEKTDKKEITPYDRATATRREDFAPVGNDKGISAALGKSGPRASGVTASPAGVSTTPTAGGSSSFLEDLKTAREALRDPETEAATKSLNALIARQGERAGQLKEQGMNQFFMDYGAALAQGAAQPGQARGRGLSGLLQSAAAAAPAGAQSIARTKSAIAQAEDNNLKMQLEMQKYNIALRKGDLQTATSLASNIRMMQQQQAQLAETIRHNKASEGLMGQRLTASNNAMDRAVMQTKANIWTKSVADANKNFMMLPPAEKQRYGSPEGYAKALFQEGWANAMPQLELMGKMSKDDVGG